MKRWLMVAAFVAAGCAQAQLREVRTVEGVAEYALPNGLTVLLHEDASKPTATVAITYRAGSRHEGPGETGAAHLLEHMLFRPSPASGDPKQEMTRRGVRWNGTTSWERTNYFGQFAANEATLQWMVGWLADAMVNAPLRAEDLKAEIPVVRNEFERSDNNGTAALGRAMMATAFHWHAYGKPPIGTMSDVEAMTPERLRSFYVRHYRPDNAVLVLGGKFDRTAAMREVERAFGPIPRGSGAVFVPPTREPVQEGEREVVVRRTGGVPAALAGYHIVPGNQPKFAAFRVLAAALSEPGGPLEKALVDAKLALATGGGAGAQPDPGTMTFVAALADGPEPEARARAAAQALVRVLENAPALDDQAIDRARQRLLQGTRGLLRDPESVSLALSEAVALGDWRLLFAARQWLEAVTPDQVRGAAREWLVASNRTTGLYVPMAEPPHRAPAPEPTDVAALLKDFRGRDVTAAPETAAFEPMAIEAALVRARLQVAGRPGLRVVVLNRPAKDGRVVGFLRLHWGTVEGLGGQDTAADFAGSFLGRSVQGEEGAGVRSALLAMDASLSLRGGMAGASAMFEAPAARVPDVLALAARLLREPSWPATSLEKLREPRLTGLRVLPADPGGLASHTMGLAATAQYPEGDPRRLLTVAQSTEQATSMTLAGSLAFWKRFAGASEGELVLVGPLDAALVAKAAQDAFGTWASGQPYAPMTTRHAPLAPQWQQLQIPAKANAVYLARLPIAMDQDHPDYNALAIGVGLLNGRTAEGLSRRVREKEGLTYGIGAGLSVPVAPFGDAAAFSVSASFAPANLQRLRAVIHDELKERVRTGYTEQQVQQQRDAMLASREHILAEPGSLATFLASNEQLGRTMHEYVRRTEALRRTTAQDVNAALRRYIDPAKLFEVAAGTFAPP